MKKKILLVFGTRPETIKMAPLIKELQQHQETIEAKICVTGQHRQMLDQILSLFEIVPDYDLDIMTPGQDLFDITSKILLGMRDVLNAFNPDLVMVHGDTTTSMAAALSAFYKQIKIAHVEAGLRTNNLHSPWPEEMNRRFTDIVCDYYFAPTERSKNNLLREGVDPGKVFVTGNTVIDALVWVNEKINSNAAIREQQEKAIQTAGYAISNRPYLLVTGHRRENFGEGFLHICKALQKIARCYPSIDIVYPVHLNPNVQEPVRLLLSDIPNIYLISPLDYLPFVYLMKYSRLILTDSGGVQEEAPSLGKPVLVMRDTTERPEAIEAGTVKLVGTEATRIFHEVRTLLESEEEYNRMSASHNPYGDGNAGKRIAEILI